MVMIIVPFTCNVFQFWVIDNILKFNPSNKDEMEMLKDGESEIYKKDTNENDNNNDSKDKMQKSEIELS